MTSMDANFMPLLPPTPPSLPIGNVDIANPIGNATHDIMKLNINCADNGFPGFQKTPEPVLFELVFNLIRVKLLKNLKFWFRIDFLPH